MSVCYVDDLLKFSENIFESKRLKTHLDRKLVTRDLVHATQFLEMGIRKMSENTIGLR